MTEKRDRWIPWMFVLGLGIVVAVNGVMTWFAVTTFPGLTNDQAYEYGRTYNRVLAEADRQAALGWRVEVVVEPRGEGGGTGRLVVTAQDRSGAPLDLLAVEGLLRRTVEPLPDVPVALRPAGGGRYVADLVLPRPGQWEARLALRGRGGREELDVRRRVILP